MVLSKKLSKLTLPFVVLFITILMCTFLLPQQAQADDYSVTNVDIDATVKDDASLHVVEDRTFSFDGSFTCVWWKFDSLPQNSTLDINGVSLKTDEDSKWQKLKKVEFQYEWTYEGGPGGFAYSVDEEDKAVYVFFKAEDTDMQVMLDMTYNNAVQIYEDTAELYWKYVGTDWEVDSENVTMSLTLPNPFSSSFELGSDVCAWGHGNLSGSLAAGSENNIIYDTGTVKPGKYAEARVLFPKSWVSNAPKVVLNAHSGIYRTNEVLEQEQQWADEANRERMFERLKIFGFAGICLIIIVACIFMYLRFGREYKPNFTNDYWRDDPLPGTNPAVIGRIWRMNKEDKNDFMTVIMYLCDKGFINLGVEKVEKDRLIFGTTEEELYYLDRVKTKSEEDEQGLDDISNGVLDLIFNKIGNKHAKRVYLTEISDFAKDDPDSFKSEIESWQASVETETLRGGFFEQASLKWQKRSNVLSFLPLVVSFILLVISDFDLVSICEFFCALITLAICLIVSRAVSKRSQLGADVNAKCEALRKWLKDFTALDEYVPTDIKVWGKYMVYAHLFGIAEEVMHKLKNAIPSVFGEDAYTDVNDTTYIPWYWFWYSHGSYSYTGNSFNDVFSDSFTEAFDAAFSDDSSGGGFGGGFSGGGGGGFGGGGGGAR